MLRFSPHLVLAMLLVGLAVAPSASAAPASHDGVREAAPAAPASTTPQALRRRAGCSVLTKAQSIGVRGRMRQVAYTEYYSGGGRPTRTTPEEQFDIVVGEVDIRLATCKTPSGRWRVIDPVDITPRYEGIDAAGEIDDNRSVGWGFAPRKITTSALSLVAMRCSDAGLLSTGKFLLGVPLPIPFVVDVGRFVASNVIPDEKVRCQQLTRLSLRLRIDRKTGKVSLVRDSGHWMRFQDRGQRQPNEKQVWDAKIAAWQR